MIFNRNVKGSCFSMKKIYVLNVGDERITANSTNGIIRLETFKNVSNFAVNLIFIKKFQEKNSPRKEFSLINRKMGSPKKRMTD